MVLVSHTHKFIYLKPVKTAGTSVEMLLQPFCMPAGHPVEQVTDALFSPQGVVGRRDTPPRRPLFLNRRHNRWQAHSRAKKVRRWVGARVWDALVKIATIRDPFDRAVSYFCWKNQSSPISTAPFAERRAVFAQMVASGRLKDIDRIIFTDGTLAVDRFIRFEHLRADLRALAQDLKLPLDLTHLPHAKRIASRDGIPLADWYDRTTSEGVLRDMAWAFDTFGYATHPGAAAPADSPAGAA